MSTIPLDTAPPGVDVDTWVNGAPARPAAGDLWLLSWDGHGLGLGVIASRHDGFVLVWPVSLPGDPVAPPAVQVDDTPLGVPLFPWPSRETGIGDALLHRRLGPLLAPEAMGATADAFEDGTPPPLPFAPTPPPQGADAADTYSRQLIDTWERICFIQWPAPDAAETIYTDALRAAGLAPSEVADLLNLPTDQAVAIFLGQAPVTPEQASTLEGAAQAEPGLLRAPMLDAAARKLIDPGRKAQVLAVSGHRNVSESQARDLVASQFALAARSNANADARLDAVFARLLADH
ncbi:hypothetical protein [Pseudactinotalea sp. HY158]|uniref:hypothetical protein n=1 Tax=Pseudactinotalea sp. HY158 TaxID=2654547 RepID=UPI00129C64F0|nr:hypothetical protein [Pseudactinotalea sp. HY158]QGH69779.1 hypothetical protein GCE65_09835 [Pseudactinotalea sp. HY158]